MQNFQRLEPTWDPNGRPNRLLETQKDGTDYARMLPTIEPLGETMFGTF